MDKEVKTTKVRVAGLRCQAGLEQDIEQIISDTLLVDRDKIKRVQILRKAVDARQDRIDFVYTVAAEIKTDEPTLKQLTVKEEVSLFTETEPYIPFAIINLKKRPVIIGSGPAGLFAAVTLLERGVKAIVIERGQRISDRTETVNRFWKEGSINPESNMFFGEGGAGTFSDGKLTTRIKSSLKQKVLETLVEAGAPSDILYLSKPHLGTDNLQKIVRNIVDKLADRGVEFRFNTKAEDIVIEQNTVKAVAVKSELVETETVFLATGHSARDVHSLLLSKGVCMEAKGFAAGLRIEHPQGFVDEVQLGRWKNHKELTPADYFLSFQDKKTSRGVYTFCMCPGGYVVGCSSGRGELCTNGMSFYDRSSSFANAAIVVTVSPDDLQGKDVLKGLEFQTFIERQVFEAGGGNFFAPVQRAEDFIKGAAWDINATVSCSYRPGIKRANMQLILPEFISEPIKRALKHFDKKFPGFLREGLLIGAETRTSSPVRIKRNSPNLHSENIKGLIPVGEGSGYAGGIMSSAVDGIKAAMMFDTEA